MTGPRRQRGLSIVELMVGSAISLVVIAGGLKLFAAHVDSTRHLLVRSRVHQDLRAAGDLIARDLRRAGYWQTAAPTRARNPYHAIGAANRSVTYSYSGDKSENNELDSDERHGFRLSSGVLQALAGGAGWQPLTDPASVEVTRFEITPRIATVPLGHLCTPACGSEDPACPALHIREYAIRIEGHASADPRVVRRVVQQVRVRNDDISAVECP